MIGFPNFQIQGVFHLLEMSWKVFCVLFLYPYQITFHFKRSNIWKSVWVWYVFHALFLLQSSECIKLHNSNLKKEQTFGQSVDRDSKHPHFGHFLSIFQVREIKEFKYLNFFSFLLLVVLNPLRPRINLVALSNFVFRIAHLTEYVRLFKMVCLLLSDQRSNYQLKEGRCMDSLNFYSLSGSILCSKVMHDIHSSQKNVK